LAMEVAELLRQVGARATITYDRTKARKIEGRSLEPSDRWCINVSDRTSLLAIQPVLDGLKATLNYVDSAYSKAGQKTKELPRFGSSAFAVPIKSIRIAEELGRPMVYDITVAKTHRFLTSAGVGCANTGGGEPTVHPNHVEIFNHTLERGLDLALVSNGYIFRPGLIDALLRSKWVRFSIDAGNRETYASVRRVPLEAMERTKKNIASLVEARAKQQTKSGLIIGIGFVVTAENWREVVDAARQAKETGVDNFRISAVFQPDDDRYFEGFHKEAAELCQQAAELSDSRFRVFNRFSARFQDLQDKHPDYSFCGYQFFNTYLGATLDLFRCCVTSYSEMGRLASIKDRRLKDVWLSDELQGKLRDFDASGCPRCLFNNVNKTINYALGDDAPHVNFV
jgi:MoaA/NifB/PqqE/SkfB family radical SAM enzyme